MVARKTVAPTTTTVTTARAINGTNDDQSNRTIIQNSDRHLERVRTNRRSISVDQSAMLDFHTPILNDLSAGILNAGRSIVVADPQLRPDHVDVLAL